MPSEPRDADPWPQIGGLRLEGNRLDRAERRRFCAERREQRPDGRGRSPVVVSELDPTQYGSATPRKYGQIGSAPQRRCVRSMAAARGRVENGGETACIRNELTFGRVDRGVRLWRLCFEATPNLIGGICDKVVITARNPMRECVRSRHDCLGCECCIRPTAPDLERHDAVQICDRSARLQPAPDDDRNLE